MIGGFQYIGQILAFAEGALGVRRAPAPSFEPWPANNSSVQSQPAPAQPFSEIHRWPLPRP